jgi:hypothetical protein
MAEVLKMFADGETGINCCHMVQAIMCEEYFYRWHPPWKKRPFTSWLI